MCKGFAGKQVELIEKGIEAGVKEYFKKKGIEGEVSPEVVAKVMAQLYMGLVCSSVAAGEDVDVEEGERLIEEMVDFFLK